MEEKFKESQTSLISIEIDLKELQSILKKYSQIFVNTSKSSFSHSFVKGVSPGKEDGVPSFIKKMVDFINVLQIQFADYGESIAENMMLISQMLDCIAKTKKKQTFLFENCQKRINFVEKEFQANKKKLATKSQAKGKLDFFKGDNGSDDFDRFRAHQMSVKCQILGFEIQDLDRKEHALWENVRSAQALIESETEKCLNESESLRKKIIKKLSENLQDISQKNFILLGKMRKANEKYLGIKKLGEISMKSVSGIFSRNESKISQLSRSKEQQAVSFLKPPKGKEQNVSSFKRVENFRKQKKRSSFQEISKTPGKIKSEEKDLMNILGHLDTMDAMENFSLSSQNRSRMKTAKNAQNHPNDKQTTMSVGRLNCEASQRSNLSSSSLSRINVQSICSLSTREEQQILKNFDCYQYSKN